MNLKKISSNKKILLTSIVIIFICCLSIRPANAVAQIVGSDYDENSYFRIEMDVYKENDADPNYDYYLVKIEVRDLYHSSTRKLFYEYLKIFCYTSGADRRLSEEEPEPGTYYSDYTVGVTFFWSNVYHTNRKRNCDH